ncbi:MAG TPA: response regulator, partial [Nitrososphaera sp.]|nr:response regulator [Nitrososphaera sp.]
MQNNSVENQGIVRSQELKSLRGQKVLVIDDQEDITRSLKMALEKEGLEVTVYNDPVKAISDFKAGHFNLVIVDIRMPAISGFDVYAKIKAIDNRVKVCFLTAFGLYEDELSAQGSKLDETKCL